MIQIKKSKKKIILIQKTLGKYDEGPSSCAEGTAHTPSNRYVERRCFVTTFHILHGEKYIPRDLLVSVLYTHT